MWLPTIHSCGGYQTGRHANAIGMLRGRHCLTCVSILTRSCRSSRQSQPAIPARPGCLPTIRTLGEVLEEEKRNPKPKLDMPASEEAGEATAEEPRREEEGRSEDKEEGSSLFGSMFGGKK